MENIRQALERARSIPGQAGLPHRSVGEFAPPGAESLIDGQQRSRGRTVALDPRHLESNRIIAHDQADARAIAFDMLRTQVLQAMDQKNWTVIGITSPSPDCGKTLTAANLALSVARQPNRAALLIDLDLRKANIANYLGFDSEAGLVGVLRGQATLADTLVQAEVGRCKLTVLATATETARSDSSAWITSRALSNLLAEIKRDYRDHTIILDLPPILASDDVIALLPQLDCVLLVAAIGHTTIEELEECNRHLQSTQVVRIALNKAPPSNAHYYPYY
jgi:protein-tyrosine kinase